MRSARFVWHVANQAGRIRPRIFALRRTRPIRDWPAHHRTSDDEPSRHSEGMKTVQCGWGRWHTSSEGRGWGVTFEMILALEVAIFGSDLTLRCIRVGRDKGRKDLGVDNCRRDHRIDPHPLTDRGQHRRGAGHCRGGTPYSCGGWPSLDLHRQSSTSLSLVSAAC